MTPMRRPKNGPFWAVSTQAERKPDEVHFPLKNAKKRHLRRHTRKGWTFPQFPQFPRGNPGDSGGIWGTCSPLLRA